MSVPTFPARGLYLITPDSTDTDALLQRTQALLPFARVLQYRNKSADAAMRHAQAHALRVACTQNDVHFIVNDDVKLAVQVGADGVHLGEHDGAVADARRVLGAHASIGVSCYDDIARARDAVAAGADYIAFGALFASSTKPLARRAAPALFAQAAALGVPRVAIGGITADNAATAIAAGADVLAVIGGIYDAADPVAAAQRIAAAFHA